MGTIGAAEAQREELVSNTFAVNKLNASYRQNDYFFLFSFARCC
jgi:hypothetical protein